MVFVRHVNGACKTLSGACKALNGACKALNGACTVSRAVRYRKLSVLVCIPSFYHSIPSAQTVDNIQMNLCHTD